MRNQLAAFPWFAPVLALYPALHVAVTNPGQVRPLSVAAVILCLLAASLVALTALRPPMKTRDRAAMATLWLAVLFYGYGPVNGWWLESAVAGLEQEAVPAGWAMRSPQLLQSVAWILLFAAGLPVLRRIRDATLAAARGFLNVAAALLLAVLAAQSLGRAAFEPPATGRRSGVPATAVAESPASRPDIYLIVLDGYARADVLTRYYRHDNARFLDALKQRGFQVSTASRANYYWTFLSLGSALNYGYLQSVLDGGLDPDGIDREAAYRVLRDNRAAAFLRERGYRYVHYQSTWGGTGLNPYADEFVSCQAGIFGDEYVRALADISWLRALGSRAGMDIANCHLRNLESLAAQGRRPGPKFVFAHFLPPHHPYLFGREGQVLRRANLSDQFEFQKKLWERREPYVDQLAFMNERLLGIVERLLADSPVPPVILLISDHGPNLRNGIPAAEQRRIRLANFTAALLPGAPPGLLPDDSTPVNLFRRVFNHYFKAGLPLLPDHFYVSPYTRPFDFTEVNADGTRIAADAS